ncbi:hypothetical protein AMTRI_Chr03g55910 [Amborella trichopoda]
MHLSISLLALFHLNMGFLNPHPSLSTSAFNLSSSVSLSLSQALCYHPSLFLVMCISSLSLNLSLPLPSLYLRPLSSPILEYKTQQKKLSMKKS